MLLKVFVCCLVVGAVNSMVSKQDVQYIRKILSQIPKEHRRAFLSQQLYLGYAKTLSTVYEVDEKDTQAIFRIMTEKLRNTNVATCEPICFTADQCIDPCDPNIYPP